MNNFNIIPKFVEYLTSRGMEYEITDEVFINFKYKNLNYMFQYYQNNDPCYFRIMLPKINNKQVNNELTDIAKELNLNYKAVKTLEFEPGSIWMLLESFVYSMDNIEMLFSRIIETLAIVIQKYREKEAEL